MVRKGPAGPGGLIIVDKPSGMTSHDVVSKVRRLAKTRRVGHAGTLDPMATGVLVIGVERSTKLLNHLVLTDKTYTATIRLGAATTTDDADGEITDATDASGLSRPQILAGIAILRGEIQQRPSSVSAIKVDGERAYVRVRAGETVDLAARPVVVSRFELISEPRLLDRFCDLDVIVDCSSGTYVRALARDLGQLLGVGGHLTVLRRTRVGPFSLDQALTLDELAELADPIVLPLPQAIGAAMPIRQITEAEAAELSFGRTIEPVGIRGTHGALKPGGVAVALLEESAGRSRPVLGFTPAGS
ncbi:MAG: tRNA pseudouridine55 synthase [Pseudonocardiales bacterium]|jgi:tRNA pseudouridine55 synthase|nr:tRNA pseudouridine55 synthase [Pseudonocardiales bacterium]